MVIEAVVEPVAVKREGMEETEANEGTLESAPRTCRCTPMSSRSKSTSDSTSCHQASSADGSRDICSWFLAVVMAG
eukprot:4355332-Prymnesium_polylepis.1